jgi:transcriptional regulator of acetoin/glycerol metabolism
MRAQSKRIMSAYALMYPAIFDQRSVADMLMDPDGRYAAATRAARNSPYIINIFETPQEQVQEHEQKQEQEQEQVQEQEQKESLPDEDSAT